MQTTSSLDSQWPELIASIGEAIDIEATVRSSRALIRRREVRSGEQLLRLILAYGPGGLSLRSAAAWAGIVEGANLTDTAVMKRVRGAADWLGEIAGALVRRATEVPAASSGPLGGRRLRIVDSSVICRPGSKGVDWRLHALYDPAVGRFTDLNLTDGLVGERFERTSITAGDVVLGDRGYARALELQALSAVGADFIVRASWTGLRLLGSDATPLAWEPIFDGLQVGAVAEHPVTVELSVNNGNRRSVPPFQARLIVLRLPPGAAVRAAKAAHRRHSRYRAGRRMHPLTLRSSGYLMLITSLPTSVPAQEVLAAYRLRWQVELAFKRLKSLLGLDRLPAKSDALARSWLLAHLIFALLIDNATRDHLPDSPPFGDRQAAASGLAMAHHRCFA